MAETVLILGYGRMGSIVAGELQRSGYSVIVADNTDHEIPAELGFIKADLSSLHNITSLIFRLSSDLIVGCLPAKLGVSAMVAAIQAKIPMVDMSYTDESLEGINRGAQSARIPVLVDCGVAPGISNLIVGRIWKENKGIKHGEIYVGGMARDKSAPYGYSLTWAPEDLLAEYTRPARLITNRKTVTKPALSNIHNVTIGGQSYEAFLTDGLRTLLKLRKVRYLRESTVRWSGHVDSVKPLIKDGTFLKEIRNRCTGIEDMVVFLVSVDGQEFQMVEYPRDNMTAMQRTTALSCAAFAKVLLECGNTPHGVVSPEELGKDLATFQFVLDDLARHDIYIVSP
jgi:saccharopine dehydrogenase-like NADP-dependent oxidoreductase